MDAGGFTPAYAGKIMIVVTKTGYPMVHPRIRGEDKVFDLLARIVIGSPPHTRGRLEEQ